MKTQTKYKKLILSWILMFVLTASYSCSKKSIVSPEEDTNEQSGALNWEQALVWAENLEYRGYSDWRLPNAKELQSIVDYSRSPSTTGTAAINPIFNCTSITNEAGDPDYPFYWTSTTHVNSQIGGTSAAYVCFGRGLGYMNNSWIDVHGAGAQRSDPKSGDPNDYSYGHGPQGDAIRINNYVRCVRGGSLVDTGQKKCFDNSTEITSPSVDQSFYGQDAQYNSIQPAYQDNGDGTVTDLNTGLMWQEDPGEKKTYAEAVSGATNFNLAGYKNWRLPTIKELYSLILFSGTDPSGYEGSSTSGLVPFINTDYFDFEYGNTNAGERIIDSQWITSTEYVGGEIVFGVNFADGRIKGYGTGPMPGQSGGKEFFVLYVRGNTNYGINNFADNGDGTITDQGTGLMWMQFDSGFILTDN
jgi:hypothetical protein